MLSAISVCFRPRCQRIFRAPFGLVGHLRIICTIRTAPTVVPPSISSSSSTPSTNSDRLLESPLPSSSSSSSSSAPTAPTSAVVASEMQISTTHNPDTTTNTKTTTLGSRIHQDYTRPHCDRTLSSHIGLVGHLRLHPTDTDEPVPGAPTSIRHPRPHCPHCLRTFTHCMGLFGHMRTHQSGIDRSPDTSTMPSPFLTPSPCAPNTTPIFVTDTDTPASHAHTVPAHSPHVSAWSVT
ncbi:hypothetical protein SprV_0200607100 [Sparganum proliferum]